MKYESDSSVEVQKKITLAYDASCSMCVETARSVESSSGGKILVSPLNSNYVMDALSQQKKILPNKPMLIVETEGKYSIFTGFLLGLQLTKFLGVTKSWKVLEALGDRRNFSNSGRDFSRKSFLRGVLGATSAAIMLSGIQPSYAKTKQSALRVDWFQDIQIEESIEMDEQSVNGALQLFLENEIAEDLGLAFLEFEDDNVISRAVLHKAKDGKELVALSVQTPARVYFLYRGEGFKSETLFSSRVLELEDGQNGYALQDASGLRVNLVAASEQNHVTAISPQNQTLSSGCDQAACQRKGRCYSCVCTSWDLKCLVNCCGPCAFACGTPWSCLACIGIWCVVCANWSSSCCRARACQYVDRPSCS